MRRLLVPVLAAALLLAGCTSQGLQGGTTNDGVTEWRRPTTVVDFAGPTVAGARFSSADHRGDVLVVNFWYQTCTPCNTEAPVLKSLSREFAKDQVQFVGINTEDDRAGAESFERHYGIAYPSILDQSNGAAAQLAFQSTVPPYAIPSTLVLDRQGRVTARIVGQADASVLKTLITTALNGGDA